MRFKKGNVPWNKNTHIQTNTGRTHFKKGYIPWNKDIPCREETKGKISLKRKGQHNSPTTEFKKGHKQEFTKKHRENLRKSRITFLENNPECKEKLIEQLKPFYFRKGYKSPLEFEEKRKASLKKFHEENPNFFKGRHFSPRTEFKKGDKRITGKNNPNWKDGITPLAKQIRTCYKYLQWRKENLERDNYTCQKCGKRGGGELHVHHYPQEFSEIIEKYQIKTLKQALECKKLWDIDGGKTLCKKCHLPFNYV